MNDTEASSAALDLRGPLTVRESAAIRDRLIEALSLRQSVVVDCSGADSVDLSFIQLMLAARRSAQQAGKRFALAAPAGAALHAALAAGGFTTPSADPFWAGDT